MILRKKTPKVILFKTNKKYLNTEYKLNFNLNYKKLTTTNMI